MYLLLNGVFAFLMFFGIGLVYEFSGSLNYVVILERYHLFTVVSMLSHTTLIQAGVILILVNLFFKLGSAPFAVWIGFVYGDLTVLGTIFLMSVLKVGMFFIFLKYSIYFAVTSSLFWRYSMIFVAACGFLFSLTVVYKTSIRKIFALTATSQISYVLVSLADCSPSGVVGALVFLVVYCATVFVFFVCYCYIENYFRRASEGLKEPRSLFNLRRKTMHKIIKIAALVCLLSFAGVPPLPGFFTKVVIMYGLFKHGYFAILFVALVNSVVMLYVYVTFLSEFLNSFLRSKTPYDRKFKMVAAQLHKTARSDYRIAALGISIFAGFLSFSYSFLNNFSGAHKGFVSLIDILTHRHYELESLIPAKNSMVDICSASNKRCADSLMKFNLRLAPEKPSVILKGDILEHVFKRCKLGLGSTKSEVRDFGVSVAESGANRSETEEIAFSEFMDHETEQRVKQAKKDINAAREKFVEYEYHTQGGNGHSHYSPFFPNGYNPTNYEDGVNYTAYNFGQTVEDRDARLDSYYQSRVSSQI